MVRQRDGQTDIQYQDSRSVSQIDRYAVGVKLMAGPADNQIRLQTVLSLESTTNR